MGKGTMPRSKAGGACLLVAEKNKKKKKKEYAGREEEPRSLPLVKSALGACKQISAFRLHVS